MPPKKADPEKIPQPVRDPLRKENGEIDVANLRQRVKYEIRDSGRQISYVTFAEKVCTCGDKKIKDWLNSDADQCGFVQYQMYDWCELSEDDQMEVLAGNPPKEGHFEKRVKRPGGVTDEDDAPSLELEDPKDLTMNLTNIGKRLNYELQLNNWTMTQFAFRVLQEGATGAHVAKMIKDPSDEPPYDDYYSRTLYWLQQDENKRRAWISGWRIDYSMLNPKPTPKPKAPKRPRPETPPPIEEINDKHMEFLKDPTGFNIKDPRFKKCMLFLVNREKLKLKDQIKEMQPGTIYNELNQNPQTIDRFNDTFSRFVAGDPESRTDDNEQIKLDRLITLAFMDGAKTDLPKLGKCLNIVLGNETRRETFAKKVLNCGSSHLKNLIRHPGKYNRNVETREKYILIRRFLMKNREEREKMLAEPVGDAEGGAGGSGTQ